MPTGVPFGISQSWKYVLRSGATRARRVDTPLLRRRDSIIMEAFGELLVGILSHGRVSDQC